MRTRSDMEVKNKELGEADAIWFLSQIRYEKKDYIAIQDKLFKNMSVDEIAVFSQEWDSGLTKILRNC